MGTYDNSSEARGWTTKGRPRSPVPPVTKRLAMRWTLPPHGRPVEARRSWLTRFAVNRWRPASGHRTFRVGGREHGEVLGAEHLGGWVGRVAGRERGVGADAALPDQARGAAQRDSQRT